MDNNNNQNNDNLPNINVVNQRNNNNINIQQAMRVIQDAILDIESSFNKPHTLDK